MTQRDSATRSVRERTAFLCACNDDSLQVSELRNTSVIERARPDRFMQPTGLSRFVYATSVINPGFAAGARRFRRYIALISACRCDCNSCERGNFEVDRFHSTVLTNARGEQERKRCNCRVARGVVARLIHATLSSQTNLVARCLINLTPRCT